MNAPARPDRFRPLDANALLAMWLRDRIAELHRDAARARRAYSRGPMKAIADRLATCHEDAAACYQAELDRVIAAAPVSRDEGR